MPRQPWVRAAMLARSAAGRPPRATLRLHRSLDSWCQDVQRGHGGVVSVLVASQTFAAMRPRLDTEKALAVATYGSLRGVLAILGGTCGRGAPPARSGELPARRATCRYGARTSRSFAAWFYGHLSARS